MKSNFVLIKKAHTSLFLAVVALLLILTQSATFAGSATWDSNPGTFDWNTDGNWTPNTGFPNGSSDVATFDVSNTLQVSISANVTVSGITFDAGANAFLIGIGTNVNTGVTLTISGAGITNNSAHTQAFVTGAANGVIDFFNNATAGSNTTFTNLGGANGGVIQFFNTSTADHATITNNSATVGTGVGQTVFRDTSTAGSSTITNDGSTISGQAGGTTDFNNTSTAGSSTITNNGGTVTGAPGGLTRFFGTDATHFSTAGSATITNNGGTVSGASGGLIQFSNSSTAGSSTITNNGGAVSGASGARTDFNDTSTAGSATITNNGGAANNEGGGSIRFLSGSTAGSSTITNNGGTASGALGGNTTFFSTSTAENATLIANGGVVGAGAGSIRFSDSSTGGMATVKVFGDGFLAINNHNAGSVGIGSLEGSGNVFLGANNLSVGSNNLSTTFSGVMQDNGLGGSLTKTGMGTLTLSGANTYTGATTVNGGTLLVNGSITSDVTVNNSGTTLGGTGTIGGTVTVNAGANLHPGTSPGILNTGSVTLVPTSNFLVDINGPALGTQYSQLNVTGTVTLGGSNLVVTVGGTLMVNQTFTIITSTGAVSDMFAQGISVTGSNGDVFSIDYTSNDVVLTATSVAVPEPSTWVAGALALAFVGYTQRRRFAQMFPSRIKA